VNVHVYELRVGFSNTTKNPEGIRSHNNRKELTSLPLIHVCVCMCGWVGVFALHRCASSTRNSSKGKGCAGPVGKGKGGCTVVGPWCLTTLSMQWVGVFGFGGFASMHPSVRGQTLSPAGLAVGSFGMTSVIPPRCCAPRPSKSTSKWTSN